MNEVEINILRKIGEDPDNPDVFIEGDASFDLIRDSVNDAIEEIALITGSVIRTYKMPLRANANFYRLQFEHERFAWIKDVWLHGVKRRLIQMDFLSLVNENPRWLYNAGSPVNYFLASEVMIGIHPAPSSSDDMLEITAVVVPDRYSLGTSRLKIRDQFKWAITYYVVSEYYASRGAARQARYHFDMYLDKMGMLHKYPAYGDKVHQYQTIKRPADGTIQGQYDKAEMERA